MKKRSTARIRFLVMIAVLAVAAVGFFTAFGLGSGACGIGFGDITLLCPLGAVLVMISERAAVPMAVVSVLAVLAICIVLGKVFCSWVCPVHFLSRLRPNRSSKAAKAARKLDAAQRDMQAPQEPGLHGTAAKAVAPLTEAEKAALKGGCAHPCGKSRGVKIDSRHGILAAALASTAVFGFPVFCLICPVGLTFATVMLVMRLFAFGETTWTIVAFVAIVVVEVLLLPRWCQRFCPIGALLSLFSAPNRTLRPTVDASRCLNYQGKVCNRCVKVCPEEINLHDVAAGATTLNDCSKCKVCADECPTGAISFPFFVRQGNDLKAPSAIETANGGKE